MAEPKKADKAAGPRPGGAQAGKAGQPTRPKGGKAAPAAEPQGPAKRASVSGTTPPRMRERFRSAVVPALMKEDRKSVV